jgi:hypothetical protein
VSPELRVRRRNGRIEGPYGIERIKALLRSGDLAGSEDISENGVAWRAMTSHPELNAVMNELAATGPDAETTGATHAFAFGQVDLDPGDGGPLEVERGARPTSSLDGELDLGLEPDSPESPPPSAAAGPSAIDELMGSLDLDLDRP